MRDNHQSLPEIAPENLEQYPVPDTLFPETNSGDECINSESHVLEASKPDADSRGLIKWAFGN